MSASLPRVSVLMAVYNAEPYLREAVDSVLGQTIGDVELLAVDDASTDQSLAILRQYANEQPSRVRVFAQRDNQGQAVARNLALRHARGEFVCMLDADDWLSPDALELALREFTSADVGCCVFRLLKEWDDRTEPYPMPLPTDRPITGQEAFRLSLSWQLHGLYLTRRKLHLRYPYDTSCRLYSDDNTSRLHYLHSPLVAFCQGEYHYRQHPLSSTTAISPRRFLLCQANLSLKRTLESEAVSPHILAQFEKIRWYNYKGQLRLYHLNRRRLLPEERLRVHSMLRTMYGSFSRRPRVPFPLFELRQWLGSLLRR
ncbi:MAG: glycosyltransferase [Prevotellaceae bacterium]|nr:glycosyltransferase [Prevotellaceae bacterium]